MTGSAIPLLDPPNGLAEPTSGTPPRRPGSVRRTSTVDSVRPDPDRDVMVLTGRARDIATDADGAVRVRGDASLEVEIDEEPRVSTVKALTVSPTVAGLDAMVGRPAGPGFRRALNEHTAAQPGSLEYLLLDEVPLCALVSIYMVMHWKAREGGINPVPMAADSRDIGAQPADGCAGFVVGGRITRALEEGARAVAVGPPAPSLMTDDDLSWHVLPPETPGRDRIRRWRRTDLWRDENDDLIVDSFYRDSHTAPDGVERVVHEYTLQARVGGPEGRLTECGAEARVLPSIECIPAALSAERVVGMRLDELRETVRRELTGPTICTHLNDQLRGLADIDALAGLLPRR